MTCSQCICALGKCVIVCGVCTVAACPSVSDALDKAQGAKAGIGLLMACEVTNGCRPFPLFLIS